MNTYLKALLIFCCILISSCGPSAEELERVKKIKEDSIKLAEDMAAAKRVHLEKVEVGKAKVKQSLEQEVKALDKELVKQEKKLSEIKEFQLLRSTSEKGKQLTKQRAIISEIKDARKSILSTLPKIELYQTLECQDSIPALIQFLFDCARKGDFNSPRHLLDPYGEYDRDAFQLC